MAINRYDSYEKTDWKNVNTFQLPLELMGKTLGALQDRSDKNYAELQQLPDLLKSNALDPDKPLLGSLKQDFESKIDNLVKNSNGDYSRINKDLYALKNQLRKEISPGGTIHAIGSNYNSYAANAKELQDMYKAGKIKEEDYIKGLNHAKSRYSGVGSIDPVTGVYNQYQEMAIPSFDENKAFEAAVKNIKPDELERIGISRDASGRWIQKTKTGDEFITEEKAFAAMLPQILMDPDFQRYNKFRQEVGLGDYRNNVTAMAAAKARGMAYNKHKEDLDLIYDRSIQDDRMYGLGVAKFRHQQQKDAQMLSYMQPDAPITFTNISNTGSNAPEFSAKEYAKGQVPSVTGTSNSALMPSVSTPGISSAIWLEDKLGLGKRNVRWLDENSKVAKENPLLKAAIEQTRSQYQEKKKSGAINFDVNKAEDMKTRGDEWHSAIDANYKRLKEANNFNRYSYQLGDNTKERVFDNIFSNPRAQQLWAVDENGKVNTEVANTKVLPELFDSYKDATEIKKSNRIQVGNKLAPLASGVSGIEMMIDGKQYILANGVHPALKPIEDQIADVGKKVYQFGQEHDVSLNFLNMPSAKMKSRFATPEEIKKGIAGPNEIVLDISPRNGKAFTTSFKQLGAAADKYMIEADPVLRPTIDKPAKGQQWNNWSDYEDQ